MKQRIHFPALMEPFVDQREGTLIWVVIILVITPEGPFHCDYGYISDWQQQRAHNHSAACRGGCCWAQRDADPRHKTRVLAHTCDCRRCCTFGCRRDGRFLSLAVSILHERMDKATDTRASDVLFIALRTVDPDGPTPAGPEPDCSRPPAPIWCMSVKSAMIEKTNRKGLFCRPGS